MPWFVYMLECSNGSLYVGSTTSPGRRFERHLAGDGSAHTAKCPPERMIWRESHASPDAVVARERQIKGWSRAKKMALANGQLDELHGLAKRRSP
jgi:putative endonuclease